MRNLLLVYVSLLLVACNETKLEYALRRAGDNRMELEKVLLHYSQEKKDSLKLKAACFLIENMPGHYTKVGDIFERCWELNTSFLNRKQLDLYASVYMADGFYVTEDVASITADYLIRHIDASFKLFEYSWVKELPFEIFLEYVLPYRLEYERLNLWRDSLGVLKQSTEAQEAIDEYKYDASRVSLKLDAESDVSYQNSVQLFERDVRNDCHYMYLSEVFCDRIKGIPSVLDFFPYYSNRNGSHYWHNIVSTYRNSSLIPGSSGYISGKVYRRTYSHNLLLSPGKDEYIPSLFRDPFNKDVTDVYFQTRDIIVDAKIKLPSNLHYGYLCVFNTLAWRPIAIGCKDNDAIKFENMGKNTLYLPVVFRERAMIAVNYPFALKQNGDVHYYIPDTLHKQQIRLYRKYPYTKRIEFSKLFSGSLIEGSNNADFSEKDTLAFLDLEYGGYYIDRKIEMMTPYQYLRILIADRHDIAELYFWDEANELVNPVLPLSLKEGFDRNPLTSFRDDTTSLIFDFGKRINFSRLVCLQRNDGNGIYLGETYELFYYGLNGWESLGRKKATDFFVEFDVPYNALFWLHNVSGGIEDRIFTVEDGKVRFW